MSETTAMTTDLAVRVAEHIGAHLNEDSSMSCPIPTCRGDFGPTMTLEQISVFELGYLPGAPLLAGACLTCGHVTEPEPHEEDK